MDNRKQPKRPAVVRKDDVLLAKIGEEPGFTCLRCGAVHSSPTCTREKEE